jgi:hypothetical protein
MSPNRRSGRSTRRTKAASRRLDLAFSQLWLRLSPEERQRMVDQFDGPFQRHWWVADGQGLRALDE